MELNSTSITDCFANPIAGEMEYLVDMRMAT